jgi:tetratricopeptide (TPR) repeat protein
VRNPHHPPQRVTYGQQTSDEMAELWFQVVPRTDRDRATLTASLRAKILPEEINGRRMMAAKDAGNPALHNEMALLYAALGNPSAVADEFATALRLTPDSAAARYNLGAAMLALGRNTEAEGLLTSALQIEPGRADAHFDMGQLFQAKGDYVSAVSHYRQALQRRPEDPEILLNLGVTAALTGDRAGGVDYLRQAIALRPNWPAAMGSLAWTIAVSRSASETARKEAVDLATRANGLTDGRNPAMLDILATALAADGQFERAVATSERAVTLAQASADRRAIAAFERRLELFKARSPYHEP